MSDDDLSADDLARFAAATENAIREDQTRAFVRELFAPPAEETATGPTDTGRNHVAREGANPATTDPGTDLRTFVRQVFNDNPDYS